MSAAGGGRLPSAHPCRHSVPRDRVLALSARAGGFSTSSEVAVGLVLLVFIAAVTTKRRLCFLLLFKSLDCWMSLLPGDVASTHLSRGGGFAPFLPLGMTGCYGSEP